MKQKITLKLSLVLLILGLFSCEIEDTNSLIQNDGFDEFGLDPGMSARLAECETSQEYVLVAYNDQTVVGSVTVFNDGENLNIVYEVDEELCNSSDEWRIKTTYLFVGKAEDWPFAEGYTPSPGEVASNPLFISMEHGPEYSCTATRIVPIENWMVRDCFIFATKVSYFSEPLLDGGAPFNEYVINSLAFFEDLSLTGDELFCFDECEEPGTGTPGYWKNHPEAWPVDDITIGGTSYPKEEAIDLMKEPTKGDKTFNMFEQLVAAKLNVLIGNDDSCIATEIAAADAWMTTNPVRSGVSASSDAWKDPGSALHTKLDDYNNGLLGCADHRD